MALTQNEIPVDLSLAGNPMYVGYSTDETAQDFIGINYSVYAYLNAAWELLGNEMRYEPDALGAVMVDIKKLLQWEPIKEFTWPEKVSNIIIKRNDLIRRFKIEVSEKYGNPLAENDADTVSYLRVLPGKISDLQFGLLNDKSTTWLAEQLSDKKFLTNSPRIKKTDAWASERLFFILLDSTEYDDINLNVKIHYSDGSSTSIIRESYLRAPNNSVYEFITSFSTLGLYLHNTSNIIEKYEVWITREISEVISETFTYILDHIRKSETKYFLFSNAHKMIEGVRFTGKYKNTTGYEFQESGRTLQKGYGVADQSRIKSNPLETQDFETSTEWLSIDEMNWMRELLLSQEVYEIVDGHVVPVFINTSDVIINEENSNLRALKIKYSYAHADQVPGLLPKTEDGLDAFKDTEIDCGDITNTPDPGIYFETWNFTIATELFGSQNDASLYSYALLELMNIAMQPTILHYENIGAYQADSDIVAGLTESEDYVALADVIELINDPDEGFFPLLTIEALSMLVMHIGAGNEDIQIDGNIHLYYATKRYL